MSADTDKLNLVISNLKEILNKCPGSYSAYVANVTLKALGAQS